MASKRHVRRKSCEGKFRHENKTTAISHEIGLRRLGERVVVYKCRFCKGYHVGHC